MFSSLIVIRDVSRDLSNIYDETFLRKWLTPEAVNYFPRKPLS